MKAMKIDLSSYELPGVKKEDGTPATFGVRESVVTILFHPNLKLGPVSLLEHNELAEKIRKEPSDSILLDATEYSKLKRALNCVEGMGQNMVEFVRRILNAPEVEVGETPCESPSNVTSLTSHKGSKK